MSFGRQLFAYFFPFVYALPIFGVVLARDWLWCFSPSLSLAHTHSFALGSVLPFTPPLAVSALRRVTTPSLLFTSARLYTLYLPPAFVDIRRPFFSLTLYGIPDLP